jgi:hypothetical protein
VNELLNAGFDQVARLWADGRGPALQASTLPALWMRANASAIWLNLQFSMQTNKICFNPRFLLSCHF